MLKLDYKARKLPPYYLAFMVSEGLCRLSGEKRYYWSNVHIVLDPDCYIPDLSGMTCSLVQ